MEKTFEPYSVEARWRDTWENKGYFKPSGTGAPYSIMIPPPNVTGTLHMGHAFQHTVMDILIRHARMQGRQTLWQPGTDHAGIATQMVVERNLKLAGESSRAELGRERFVEKVWEWKKLSAGTIGGQIRRMGSSVDWSREAFTMDPAYEKAVVEHFVKLFEAGLIYRGKRLVNWDPALQTAISDLEVVQEEENGFLWHLRYPLADGATYVDEHGVHRNYIVVATTRPETMLGDAAVAVHPEDPRYAALVSGRARVILPLCNREIPIIADDFVDRDFGTGAVKITPAHDFNDYAAGKRHGLDLLSIFDREGRIWDDATLRSASDLRNYYPSDGDDRRTKSGESGTAADHSPSAALDGVIPPAYRGLDRFVARKRIVADLEALHDFPAAAARRTGDDGKIIHPSGLLEKIDAHRLKVPRGDRSGAVLEPYLTDQWFVDLTRKTLADGRPGGLTAITQPALDVFVDGRIRFIPENWINTYNQWLNNIQDWCISRQLWWGHRIPAWYDADGRAYVGRSEEEIRRAHPHLQEVAGHRPQLRQDEDVFDTWFSSDIWPLATLGWPEATPDLEKFYPTSVLVTGFDIIFFWVARMVMMGLYFQKDVPFRDVFITGLVRDPEGNKMSKSKGNVLDPLDVTDGISLQALIAKRTTGLMNPSTGPKIEAKTRKDYPEGIAAVGVDALRFTFAALCTNGRDIRFDAGRAAGYRNFCNKIWNASRYVLMNLGALDEDGNERTVALDDGEFTLSVADRWITSRLQKVEAEAAGHLSDYRFDLLATCLYQFVWDEYCDWYLELTKPVMLGADVSAARGARRTLARVLETALRLLHPIMPFVTEDIWQRVAPLAGKSGSTLMTQPYPIAQPERIDETAEADVEWMKGFVRGVRQIREQMNIPKGKVLPLLLQNASGSDRFRLDALGPSISFLARVEPPRVLGPADGAPHSSTALLGEMKLLVPMAGLIDKGAELSRLDKLMAKIDSDLGKNEARLASEKFVSGAPPDVIERERARVAQQKSELRTLGEQRRVIESL